MTNDTNLQQSGDTSKEWFATHGHENEKGEGEESQKQQPWHHWKHPIHDEERLCELFSWWIWNNAAVLAFAPMSTLLVHTVATTPAPLSPLGPLSAPLMPLVWKISTPSLCVCVTSAFLFLLSLFLFPPSPPLLWWTCSLNNQRKTIRAKNGKSFWGNA